MSSSESDAASSSHSSPLQITPMKSPGRTYKKYGRNYREASSCSEDSGGTPSDNVPPDIQIQASSGVSGGTYTDSVDSDDSDSSSRSLSSCPLMLSSTSSCQTSSSDSDNRNSDSGSRSSGTNNMDSEDERDTENNGCVIIQKLFTGSKKTTDEAVLALMDLFIKKRWKVTTFKDVLHFCNEFFPNNMPKTMYKLFQYIESHTPDYSEICHYYCGDCLTPKEGNLIQCQECHSNSTGVFFELPLSKQIKHLFEQRNLAVLIDSHKSQIPNDRNIVCDITSSEGYRELKTEVKGKYDITLLFNSDGISPVHSSKAHLYPVLATICELPPQLRASFMVVCGIWYDVNFAPVMNDFLSPFVNALNRIYDEGIEWTHPTTKERFKSVVTAPVMCADALCRANVLVMTHHGGRRGCNSCEQKTKRFKPADGGKKIRRYLYQEKPAKLRDQNNMDRQGRKAARGLPVKGILGEAVVSKIPHFNRGNSAPPEYMHCVLLGVVKHFLKLWFQTPGDWNIKDKINDIDTLIQKNVKVTDHFGRIPKKIKDLTLWKASDLRVWLLFISLPALHGHLKEKYFQHWMLLVSAIYLLLKDKITTSDITMAETKLRIFVRDIAKLYRMQDCTYNVHNLLHLAQHVKRWGPLWATSAFCFENFNHILGELAHGPKHKGKQIVNKIKLAHGLKILRNKVPQQSQVLPARGTAVLGQPVVIDLDLSAFDLPCDTNGYLRANVKGTIFTTRLYDQKVVRSNSYVCYKTECSVAYGQILYFYEKDQDVNCLIKKFKVEQWKIFTHNEGRFSVVHLIPISETGTIVNTSAMSLLTKHAKVESFVCIRPNDVEKNL